MRWLKPTTHELVIAAPGLIARDAFSSPVMVMTPPASGSRCSTCQAQRVPPARVMPTPLLTTRVCATLSGMTSVLHKNLVSFRVTKTIA
jgi:hypothetical protein